MTLTREQIEMWRKRLHALVAWTAEADALCDMALRSRALEDALHALWRDPDKSELWEEARAVMLAHDDLGQ